MKRTTEWWDCDNGLYGARIKKGVSEQTALTKLAAYEDTGLEPNEIKAALREKAERKNPKPLTLEELRERIGDWIWIEVKGKSNQTGWNRLSIDLRPREHELYTNVVPEGYGKTWLAYDHEPKEAR